MGEKVKRKITIVSIVMALLLSMIVICAFVACDKDDDNRIALTIDNVEQYVTLSCLGYGDPNYYKNGYYSRLYASASTQGITGYEYENVIIDIKINFDDGKNYADPELSLLLNVGGVARDTASFLICKKDTNYIIPTTVTGQTIRANTYYKITYVSGYIKRV